MRTVLGAVVLVFVAVSLVCGTNGVFTSSPLNVPGSRVSNAPLADFGGLPFPGVTRMRLGIADLFGRAEFEFAGGTGFVTGAVHDYRVRGLWLELNQVTFLSEKTEVVLTGSYLFPANEYISEDYRLLFGLRQRKLWSTDTQLWILGVALTHRLDGPLTLAVGYSFNSFDLTFKSLESSSGPVPVGFVTAESSVAVDAHTPYLGLMAEFRSSTTSLHVGFLWCPTFFGNLEFSVASPSVGGPSSVRGPFRHAIFAGLVGEYSRTFSIGQVGVFGRWLGVPGSFDLSFEGAPISDSVLRVNANIWVVGIQSSILFGL